MNRSSRADRRRRPPENRLGKEERRRALPLTEAVVRSQVAGSEMQVFVGSPLVADNCGAARALLQQHSSRSDTPVLVIDLERCAYMDTPGLSLVFEIKKRWQEQGREFIMQNPSRAVQRIMNITRMHRVFQIRQTSTDLERIPTARMPAADTETLFLPQQ